MKYRTQQNPNRRQFLQASAAAAATLAASGNALAWPAPAVITQRAPNFLFIISDQLGLDAISAHGCIDARTPNLDRLIARGTTFMESHCSDPVCSPSRSSMLTGRMPLETGVIDNTRPIHASRPNLGQWLSDAGYETVYSGKWHLPLDLGISDSGFHCLPVTGGQGVVMDPHVTRACEAYLHSRCGGEGKPFFLVGSLLEPHDICFWSIQGRYLVPPQLPFPELQGHMPALPPNLHVRFAEPERLIKAHYTKFSDDQWQYYLYAYYRQVERLDANVGRMLDALDDTGLADNTIVIFTADHGEGRGRHSHVQKGTPYEEAVKVPLIFACADRVPQGQVDRTHLVSGIDIMDTVCDFAGVRAPKTTGRSLRPLLENQPVTWRESLGMSYRITGRVLRSDRFKYVRDDQDPVEELFDLQADPWEIKNLYQESQYAGVLQDHRRMLAEWEARLEPVPPTPVAMGTKEQKPKQTSKKSKKRAAKAQK